MRLSHPAPLLFLLACSSSPPLGAALLDAGADGDATLPADAGAPLDAAPDISAPDTGPDAGDGGPRPSDAAAEADAPWMCTPPQTLEAVTSCRPWRLCDAGCGMVFDYACPLGPGNARYQPEAGACSPGNGIVGFTESCCTGCARVGDNDPDCQGLDAGAPRAFACPLPDAGPEPGCMRHPTATTQAVPPFGSSFPVDCCP